MQNFTKQANQRRIAISLMLLRYAIPRTKAVDMVTRVTRLASPIKSILRRGRIPRRRFTPIWKMKESGESCQVVNRMA